MAGHVSFSVLAKKKVTYCESILSRSTPSSKWKEESEKRKPIELKSKLPTKCSSQFNLIPSTQKCLSLREQNIKKNSKNPKSFSLRPSTQRQDMTSGLQRETKSKSKNKRKLSELELDDTATEQDYNDKSDKISVAVKPSATRLHLDSKLSPEQQSALYRAVHKRENLFLTGSGGVGKSFMIQLIKKELEKAKFNVKVLATTGIAACNISGLTLHHWMGYNPHDSFDGFLKKAHRAIISYRWKEADVLIIDEVSMMDPKLFEIFEYTARILRKKNTPFGGLQLILVGDFAQLPPVFRSNEPKYQNLHFIFQHPIWKVNFGKTQCIELRQCFRQKESDLFAQLNRLRLEPLTQEDAEFWRRFMKPIPQSLVSHITRLFPTNNEVDEVNNAKLEACCEAKSRKIFHSESKNLLPRNHPKYGEVKAFLKNMENTCLARKQITLGIGARVMLVANLNVELGLANGICGYIIGWATNPEVQSDSVLYPRVKFEDHKGNDIIITVCRHSWKYNINSRPVGIFEQIPLHLAWALTIHKAQGLTIPKVAVSLRNVFECGQSYVALSRCTDSTGLYILSSSPQSYRVHPAVLEFYQSLI